MNNFLSNEHLNTNTSENSTKIGAPSVVISALAAGGGAVAGAGGQSTISRKSGMKIKIKI